MKSFQSENNLPKILLMRKDRQTDRKSFNCYLHLQKKENKKSEAKDKILNYLSLKRQLQRVEKTNTKTHCIASYSNAIKTKRRGDNRKQCF